jgi:hypothetical protein
MLEVMSVEVMSGYSSRRPDMYRNKRPKEGHLTFRCIEQTQHCPHVHLDHAGLLTPSKSGSLHPRLNISSVST